MENIGAAALPIVVGVILLCGFLKGVNVFDCFVEGAKDGLQATISVLPTLVGLIMAVTMLRASGLLEAICYMLEPAASFLGISSEIIPMALLRPVSGSGSTAYARDIMMQFGPDSSTGKMASVLAASTETTFYAIAVYFGATTYKKLYYTVPVALLGDVATFIFAILTVNLL